MNLLDLNKILKSVNKFLQIIITDLWGLFTRSCQCYKGVMRIQSTRTTSLLISDRRRAVDTSDILTKPVTIVLVECITRRRAIFNRPLQFRSAIQQGSC